MNDGNREEIESNLKLKISSITMIFLCCKLKLSTPLFPDHDDDDDDDFLTQFLSSSDKQTHPICHVTESPIIVSPLPFTAHRHCDNLDYKHSRLNQCGGIIISSR